MDSLNSLIDLLSKKPWVIFIVTTLAFGYAMYNQNIELGEGHIEINNLSLEVGGLRKEVEKMNEIIVLKVALAKANRECK
jgi:hypothetical protein